MSKANQILESRDEALLVTAPSQVRAGEPFTLTIAATHANGRINFHYGGSVRVASTDPKADGDGEIHTIACSGGAHKHTMRLKSGGIQRIEVEDPERGLIVRSNPIMVLEDSSPLNLYWGDIHIHVGERQHHGGISDAYAPIDYNYHFGRHVAAHDFMALSDHDHLSTWSPGIIRIWDRFKRAAEYFNRPGEFATLLGWEWTNGVRLCPGRPQYGQKCVYFRDGDGPIFSSADPGSDTPEKLYDRLRAHRCLVIPHHVSAPSNFYNDWNFHDPGLERLVEIYSIWGCGERPAAEGNPYPILSHSDPDNPGDLAGHHVKDALERGYTLGFTAGGDTHDGATGIGHTFNGLIGQFENRRWGRGVQHRAGIQGVWAEELTRESIFEAMHDRRTYGTTGARIIVRTELAGRPMGHVFPVRPEPPWTYQATVNGTDQLQKIELVRNGETVHEIQPDVESADLEFEDISPPPGAVNYYLRVTQSDGHMAWASPHFIPG
ncbi:MAG: DUF3604 domain-containing protein [Planctomycetota bacterium]|jgi:hypothetical protein|nr:DUF3604 domain-containing protein [Planctomycetota bacterium]